MLFIFTVRHVSFLSVMCLYRPRALTDRDHWTVPDIVCSEARACQHCVCLQSWSVVTQAGRQKTRGTVELWGRPRVRPGHRGAHLYFMELSISVSVHGWEVGEQSLSMRPVPSTPFTLSLCCAQNDVRFRFTSGLFQTPMNEMPSRIPGSSLIWCNFLNAILVLV